MTTTALAIVAALALVSCGAQDKGTISVDEVHAIMKTGRGVVVVDVRTPEEYQSTTGHLEGAILIPIQDLTMRLKELRPYEGDTLIVYCRTDNRSRRAVSILNENGFTAVFMKGGITAWTKANLPVVHEGGQ